MSKLYHFQYINLVFLTSFQFINLSYLALWVNNMRKWITIIFINLCNNLLYYMICFFFSFFFCLWSLYLCFYLSLCLCPGSLFLTLTQSQYQHYEFIMPYQQKNFLTLLFFFYHFTCPYYCPTTSQQKIKYSLSLSLSLSLLYYIYIKNI